MRPIIPALAPIYRALAEPAYALVRFVAGAFLVPHGMWKLFSITGSRASMIPVFQDIRLEPAGPPHLPGGSGQFIRCHPLPTRLLFRAAGAAGAPPPRPGAA